MQYTIKILKDGKIQFIYSDELAEILREAGVLNIVRASHVEPIKDGDWQADMSPVKGPVLGPFKTRFAALEAEVAWLEENFFRMKT
jgi:hypothetical protein